jgi:O-antigen/teichoic acid export membrane protein
MAATIGVFERSVDKLMVAAMASPEQFAVYVNGALEIPLIGIITGSVTSVLIPEYTRLYAEGRLGDIVTLMHRAMTSCALVILPVMAFLFVVADDLMVVLFGPAYAGSAAPFRVYLLLLPVRTLTFGALFMAMGQGRHILVQTIITLAVNIPLNWLAIRLFGTIGAAIASAIAVYLVSLPYIFVQLRRQLGCPIRRLVPWRKLCEIAFVCGAAVVLATAARCAVHGWLPLSALLVVGLTFFTATWYFFRYFSSVDPFTIRQYIGGLTRKKG